MRILQPVRRAGKPVRRAVKPVHRAVKPVRRAVKPVRRAVRAQPGPPEGHQGASRGPRGVEKWGRLLVHPYARRTSSRDPYHQVGGTPRGCRIDNCFLRFRTVAKLLRVLGAN